VELGLFHSVIIQRIKQHFPASSSYFRAARAYSTLLSMVRRYLRCCAIQTLHSAHQATFARVKQLFPWQAMWTPNGKTVFV
jgi:hypothetical protein